MTHSRSILFSDSSSALVGRVAPTRPIAWAEGIEGGPTFAPTGRNMRRSSCPAAAASKANSFSDCAMAAVLKPSIFLNFPAVDPSKAPEEALAPPLTADKAATFCNSDEVTIEFAEDVVIPLVAAEEVEIAVAGLVEFILLLLLLLFAVVVEFEEPWFSIKASVVAMVPSLFSTWMIKGREFSFDGAVVLVASVVDDEEFVVIEVLELEGRVTIVPPPVGDTAAGLAINTFVPIGKSFNWACVVAAVKVLPLADVAPLTLFTIMGCDLPDTGLNTFITRGPPVANAA